MNWTWLHVSQTNIEAPFGERCWSLLFLIFILFTFWFSLLLPSYLTFPDDSLCSMLLLLKKEKPILLTPFKFTLILPVSFLIFATFLCSLTTSWTASFSLVLIATMWLKLTNHGAEWRKIVPVNSIWREQHHCCQRKRYVNNHFFVKINVVSLWIKAYVETQGLYLDVPDFFMK